MKPGNIIFTLVLGVAIALIEGLLTIPASVPFMYAVIPTVLSGMTMLFIGVFYGLAVAKLQPETQEKVRLKQLVIFLVNTVLYVGAVYILVQMAYPVYGVIGSSVLGHMILLCTLVLANQFLLERFAKAYERAV